MNSPNLVFLIPDQLRADALGAFGNPVASTPNIDALATNGTRFDNTYVQHPVCSPSRDSILTGWYPHTAGHRTLTHLLRAHEPNLLRILKDNGYHVAWAGMRGDTVAPGVTELSVHEYGFSTWPTVAYEGEYPEGWERLFYRGPVPDDGRIDPDEAAVRTAEEWLRDPPGDRPWALFLPLVAPHCPFQMSEPWYSRIDRSDLPDPVPPGDPEREPGYMRAIRRAQGHFPGWESGPGAFTSGLDQARPASWKIFSRGPSDRCPSNGASARGGRA